MNKPHNVPMDVWNQWNFKQRKWVAEDYAARARMEKAVQQFQQRQAEQRAERTAEAKRKWEGMQ